MKTLVTVLAAVALLALGTAVYFRGTAQDARTRLAAMQAGDVRPRLPVVEARLAEAEQRVKAADDESARLLKELEGLRAAEKARAAAATPPPPTREMVQERYRLGVDLASQGDAAGAMRELLWCYDVGMVRIATMSGVRSTIPEILARLSADHPPVLAALAERRDRVEAQLLGGLGDSMQALELVALNKALGQAGRTLALLDKFPAGDVRREVITNGVYPELLEAKRYAEAAEGRSFARMLSSLENLATPTPLPAGFPEPERIRQAQKASGVTQATRDIEVLAGAGRLENARVLADKLLKIDDSPETRLKIQEHAARAGHPDLLAAAPR